MTEWTDVVRLKDNSNSLESQTDPKQPLAETWNPALPTPTSMSIPGYEILGELGRGGMGVVFKARQLSLNRLVALKVIIGGSFAGPNEKARFHMEAEAVARLHHKNIVQVYDIGQHAGIEYIAFEYVDGPTVRRWQNWEPIDPDTTARIATAVARAVQHAHDQGIIHRDLKPANILLAGAGVRESSGTAEETITMPDSRVPVRVPKVMDFGLAKSIEGGNSLTLSGVACGTPNYMAPEQVRGGPNSARPAVDVWGIGAILFEMLTGRPPFTGWDAATIMREILLNDPPSVRKIVPGVPRDLAVLVAKCLEKDPSRRYMSPGDVADDLDRFLAGQPILARAAGPIQRVKRWVHRNPLATLLGAVMVLGLAVVSTFAIALSESAKREREATDRERVALEEEARHRKEAEEATRAAEKARDDTRAAFNEVEQVLGQVQGERDRAEKNLAMARKVMSNVLTTLSSHNEGENPVLIPVYHQLLTGFEPFVEQMLAQKKGDRDLRFDQAFIVRARGLMEATSGRVATARENLLLATARFHELVKDYPTDRDCRRELGYTLACLGSVCMELGSPDAAKLLQNARETLDRYLTDYPRDSRALDSMIRVRLAMTSAPGNHYCDEHNRAVLDLVDRLADLGPLTPHFRVMRAHALNNIAGDLTNRGKTDEAEMFWLEVLAIREDLARTLPADKIMRYELAKCLTNYANQLNLTGRADQSFQFRERAAGLFDTLNEDATFRTTYISVMVNNDLVLVGEYTNRGIPAKALSRLNNAITLNSVLLERDKTVVQVRATHANAHTRRAELSEQGGRHDHAVRDYRIAIEYSTTQPHREYCTARLVQALVRSGDHSAAVGLATKLNPDTFSHPFPCVELARSWLVIAKASSDAPNLTAGEREHAANTALQNARKAVLMAQKKELFKDPHQVRLFHSQKDFEPVWDLIPRLPE